MADPKEKNWWERNVEDSWEENAKREHQMLEGNPVAQAQSDVGYGIQRGTYEFGKGLAVGLVDLAKLAYNLKTGDPETLEKTWAITKKIAKEAYIAEFGSPDEKRDQNERAWAAISGVGKSIKEDMGRQWDQAAKEGRQAALISRWVTEGVLNIAAFFVGAEEVKAAASATKAAEALEGAEAATVIIKCPKALAAEQAANAKKFADWEAAQKAAAAAKAAEDAKAAADAAEAAKAAKPKLGLGLRDRSKGLDYAKWARERGYGTYSDLSGGGPFSKQIEEAMTKAQEIHVNLDGVDIKRANGTLNSFGEPVSGYTNYEMHLLKTKPEYRGKVVWHVAGEAKPKGWMPPGF